MASFEDKLGLTNGGYPIENYSVGRFLLSISTNHGQPSELQFTDDELVYIGELISKRQEVDFNQTLISEIQSILTRFQQGITDSNLLEKSRISTEDQLLERLLSDEFYGYYKGTDRKISSELKKKFETNEGNIRGVAETQEIEVYLLNGSDLGKKPLINFALLSKKTPLSLYRKSLSKSGDILAPTDSMLEVLGHAALQSRYGEFQITPETVAKIMLDYLIEQLKAEGVEDDESKDLYSLFYSRPAAQNENNQIKRRGVGDPTIEDIVPILGGDLNKRMVDFICGDASRATIVYSDQEVERNVTKYLTLLKSRELSGKCEDNRKKGKDGSRTTVIRAMMDQGSSIEIKDQKAIQALIGHIGYGLILPHIQYVPMEERKIIGMLDRSQTMRIVERDMAIALQIPQEQRLIR